MAKEHYRRVRPAGRSPDRHPLVITDAVESPEEQLARRRRRYGSIMFVRVICMILAVSTYRFSLWLAMAFIAGGAVLPWIAVMIANDRLPKNHRPHRAVVAADPLPALPPAQWQPGQWQPGQWQPPPGGTAGDPSTVRRVIDG